MISLKIFKAPVLVLFVLIQVHLTLFTVDNSLNPITIILLLYYSPPFNGEYFPYFPEIFTFSFQSLITSFVIYILYRKIKIKQYCVAYFVCLSLLLIVCYLSKVNYSLIDGSNIAYYYYRYYNYGQAFRYIMGFSFLQLILVLTYYIATTFSITKSNWGYHFIDYVQQNGEYTSLVSPSGYKACPC